MRWRTLLCFSTSVQSLRNGFAKRTLEGKTEQSESSGEEFEGVVQADFSFFDPKPGDFHGVKNLLQNYLYAEQWDLSGFEDLILEQNTRAVNLPLQLLPHLYDALFDEVSWATEDEPTDVLRNSFKFTHYIIYSKIYRHKNAEQSRKLNNDDDDDAIIYIKPEDELFHKLKNYRSMGLVMAIEADKIPTFRKELRSLVSEP
ncbi:hypothetical protein K1719_018859 [Acacia pycnantha]|nr:hypothetical protein K1719_018859 [Acacia pycnantha]